MPRVCILLAEGFEEIEAVTIVDLLRRAEVEVVILGVTGREIRGSHGIKLEADRPLQEVANEDWDMVILPGGMPGAENLRGHPDVQALVEIDEETSLHGKGDLEFIAKSEPLMVEDEAFGVRWVVHPYLFHVHDRSKIKIDWEHQETRWVAPKDIDNYQTVPMLKETLASVYKLKKRMA